MRVRCVGQRPTSEEADRVYLRGVDVRGEVASFRQLLMLGGLVVTLPDSEISRSFAGQAASVRV